MRTCMRMARGHLYGVRARLIAAPNATAYTEHTALVLHQTRECFNNTAAPPLGSSMSGGGLDPPPGVIV
jgi:hypothetical protein